MIETITPAVCGGRNRHRVAVAAFTVGAITAAALLGGVLGLLGAAVGAREAVLAAAALAAVAAAREAGLAPVPFPQARLQVPERWHVTLPLPVWAAGYGAGLGLGVATYQPVATLWVACASALALGRPLAAAGAFSLYGLGRALMVILPGVGRGERTAVVERLASRRPELKRANALALAACAALLAAAPAAGAIPLYLGPGSQLDPSVSRGVLAYTQREDVGTGVIVRVSAAEIYPFPAATSPSLDGALLAYEEGGGIVVVAWRTAREIARVPGARKPALDWPWLAYRVSDLSGGEQLWLSNLTTGDRRLLVEAGGRSKIGRPALTAGRVAWSVVTPSGSRIGVYSITTEARRTVARSRIDLLAHPALSSSRVLWTEQRSRVSYVRLRRLDSSEVVTVASTASRDESFWTTALTDRFAYFTSWFPSAQISQIERVRVPRSSP